MFLLKLIIVLIVSGCCISKKDTRGTCKNPKYIPEKLIQLKMDDKRDFAIDSKNQGMSLFSPDLKSEPIPQINRGPVKVVVAKTFEELVLNNDKDTLVAIYAPWCKYCQQLIPQYEELAELLKDEDVDILKIDGTRNDLPPQYEAPSYPTIYFAPKESKYNPVKYEGDRTTNEMLKFITKHAYHELKNFDRRANLKPSSLFHTN